MKRQHKILFTIFVFILLLGMVSATIAASRPLSLTGKNLAEGKVGSPYSATVRATGGAEPYTYSEYKDSLPSGLNISASTGEISGVPTSTGYYGRLYISVTDAEGTIVTVAFSMNIIIEKINFDVTNNNYTYEAGVSRKATVVPNNAQYVEGKDYFVTYANELSQTDAGIYYIGITLAKGINATIGTLSQSYISISKCDNSSISINGEKNKTHYIGDNVVPFEATISPAGANYYFEYEGQYGTNYPKSQNLPTEMGKYKVTVIINDKNYTEKHDTGTLNICKYVDIAISGTSIYNKEEATPTIVISEAEFVLGRDYYLDYAIEDKTLYSMVNVGVYTPKLRLSSAMLAKGYIPRNETGSYTITQKKITIEEFRATNRIYDGSIRVYLSGGYIAGNLDGANLTALYPSSGLIQDANIGNNKRVEIANIVIGGSAAGNYYLEEQPIITVSVLPITINPKVIVATKVYNGDSIANVSINFAGITFIKADRVSATANGSFERADAGEDINVALSNIVISGNDNNNYNVVIPTGVKGNIIKTSPFSVELPAAIDSLAATANAHTLDLSQIVTSPINIGAKSYRVAGIEDKSSVIQSNSIEGNILTINTNNTAKIGDIVKIKVAIDTNNYETAYTFVQLNIIVNTINFHVTASEYDYDGTIKSVEVTSMPSITMGKDFKLDYRLNGVNPIVEPIEAGKYFIAINFIETGKYKVGTITGDTIITIRKKPVTITNLIAPSRAYNGSSIVSLSGGVIDGKVLGDDLGFTMPLDATMGDKNIGTNKALVFKPITLTGDRASSYDLTAQPIVTATISPKMIKPIVNVIPKKYDGKTQANTMVDFTGLIETGDSMTATVAGIYADAKVGIGKVVYLGNELNIIGNELGNYNILKPAQPQGDILKKDALLIGNPSDLTIKPGIANVYDFDIGKLNIKAMDMGDRTYTTEVISDSNNILNGVPSVMNSIVKISVKDTVTALDTASIKINIHSENYEDFSVILNLVTGKVEVGFTIANNIVTYNAQAQGVTVTPSISSLNVGIDYRVVYKQAEQEVKAISAGVYAVSIEMLDEKVKTHTITEIKGSKIFTISKKPVSITGLVAMPRVYNGTTDVAITGGTISGKIENDDVGLIVPSIGTIMNKKQGMTKPVSYAAITLNGEMAGNYDLGTIMPKLYVNISPKNIKPMARVIEKTFNNNSLATIVIDFTGAGLENGDVLTATANGIFEDANVGSSKAVTLSSFTVISGNNDGNYIVAIPDNPTGNIVKASALVVNKPTDMTIPPIGERTHIFDLAGINISAVNMGKLGYTATKASDVNNIIKSVVIVDDKLQILTENTIAATNIASIDINITSDNYADMTTSLDVVVAVANITVDFAISDNVVSYSGSAQVPTITMTPMVDSRDYTVEYIQDNKPIVAGAMAVGTYTMSFKFNAGSGYVLGDITNNSFIIKKKDVTIDGLVATGREYDSTRLVTIDGSGAIIKGKIDNEDVTFTAITTGMMVEAGHGSTKAVSIGNVELTGDDSANYNLVSQPKLTVDISPKVVKAKAIVSTKVYNGDIVAEVSLSFDEGAILSPDIVAVTAKGEFATAGAGEGIAITLKDIIITGNEAGNYIVTMPDSVNGDITKATLSSIPQVKGLTVEPSLAKEYIYDLSTIAFAEDDMGPRTYAVNIKEDTDAILEAVILNEDGKNASVGIKSTAGANGIAKINVVISSQNYNDCMAEIKVYVGVSEIDFIISDIAKAYSGEIMYPTITASSGITPDAYTVEYKLNGAGEVINPQMAGVYNFTITMNESKYTVGIITGGSIFTINPKTVTITGLEATNREYNGSNAVVLTGGAIDGKIGEDDVTAIMPIMGNTDNKNHGDAKPVTIAPIALTGKAAGNYVLTQPTITVNIVAKGISPAVIVVTKPYDTKAEAKASFDFAGLIEDGDGAIVATTHASFEDAEIGKDKRVILTNTSTVSGNEAENYDIIYVEEARGEIGKALATIEKPSPVTVNAEGAGALDIATLAFNSLGFGDKSYSAEIFNNESGIIESCGLIGSTINYTISASATEKQSASIKITVSTPNTQEAVTYLNLNTGVVGIDFTISKNTTVYNGLTQGVTISTVPDNMIDNYEVIYTLVGDVENVLQNPIYVGQYNVEIKIKDSVGGYIINNITGDKSFEITKKPVTISGKIANDRVYDGTKVVLLSADQAIINGKVENDTVVIKTPDSGMVDVENMGADKVVALDNITLTGIDAGNYELTEQPIVTVSIGPKKVEPTYTINGRAYDGTKNIAVKINLEDGAILNNEITVTATGELQNADAGNQTVNIANTVVGNEKGNYEIVNVEKPTVVIAQASGLTVEKLPNLGVSPAIARTYDYDLGMLKFNKIDMGDKTYSVSVISDTNSILDTTTVDANTLKILVKANAAKGNVAIIAITINSKNYEASTVNLKIDVKDIAVNIAISDIIKSYNGEEQRVTITTSPMINEADYTITYKLNGVGDAISPIDAGIYTVQVVLKPDSGYVLGAVENKMLTIGKKMVKSIATATEKIYDGTVNAVVTLGFAMGDIAIRDNDLTVTADANFDTAMVGIDKPITIGPIRISGGSAINYNVEQADNIEGKIIKAESMTQLEREKKVSRRVVVTEEINCDDIIFNKTDTGAKSYSVETMSDEDSIIEIAKIDEDGKKLIIVTKNTSQAGQTATIKLTVTMENYNDSTVNIIVKVENAVVNFYFDKTKYLTDGINAVTPVITNSEVPPINAYNVTYKHRDSEATELITAGVYDVIINMTDEAYTIGEYPSTIELVAKKNISPIIVEGIEKRYTGDIITWEQEFSFNNADLTQGIDIKATATATLEDEKIGVGKVIVFSNLQVSGADKDYYSIELAVDWRGTIIGNGLKFIGANVPMAGMTNEQRATFKADRKYNNHVYSTEAWGDGEDYDMLPSTIIVYEGKDFDFTPGLSATSDFNIKMICKNSEDMEITTADGLIRGIYTLEYSLENWGSEIKPIKRYLVVLGKLGDINEDGIVNSIDANYLESGIYLGGDLADYASGYGYRTFDVNGDGLINKDDANAIYRINKESLVRLY